MRRKPSNSVQLCGWRSNQAIALMQLDNKKGVIYNNYIKNVGYVYHSQGNSSAGTEEKKVWGQR